MLPTWLVMGKGPFFMDPEEPEKPKIRNMSASKFKIIFNIKCFQMCQFPQSYFDFILFLYQGEEWQPLQYSCLEKPRGQRSLIGYSPWGCKEEIEHGWAAITLTFTLGMKVSKCEQTFLIKILNHYQNYLVKNPL